MNRAILLIICDFLLLSLLALARFDEPEEPPPEPLETLQQAADEGARDDLIEVLKLSLEAEEANRAEIEQALSEREKVIEARDEDLAAAQQRLQETAEKAREHEQRVELYEESLQETRQELSRIEQEARELEQQKSAFEADARERQRLLQEMLQKREQELARTQALAEEAAREKEALERQKQIIETELKIRDTEKKMLEQNLIATKAELETQRVEKQTMQEHAGRLAEGVTQLAEKSDEIREEIKTEIREAQPLSLNAIFKRYQDNQVTLYFKATGSGLFNQADDVIEVPSILLSDGRSIMAVFHSSDTPFELRSSASYDTLAGQVQLGAKFYRVNSVGYLETDPRLLAVRFSAGMADLAGAETFALAEDPLKWPEAVLIARKEGYYGEAGFKLDAARSDILLMDNKLFNRIFGEFSPGEGDLVFSKTGEVIGLMLDKRECLVIDNLRIKHTVNLGDDFDSEAFRDAQRELKAQLRD